MHLRALCVFCMFATGLDIFARAATARTPSGNIDACTIVRSDTVFVTVAADVSGTELSKIDPSTSAAGNILYGATAAETEVTVASSDIPTEYQVVITSTITVLPIEGIALVGRRTTTIHTTRKETHFHTVTNTLETSTATSSTMFPSMRQDTSIQTVTSTKEPTTITLTLLLAKPGPINSHYPGWISAGLNMSSAPARVSKYPTTVAISSNTALQAGEEESSLDIYQASHSNISLSVMLAHSGFMNNSGASRTITSSPNGCITSSYTMPESLPVQATPADSIAPLVTPSFASLSRFDTFYTSITRVEATAESSAVDSSVPASSVVTHPPMNSTTLTTLAPPHPVSSSVRGTSTPRYLNTTSKIMIYNTITTSALFTLSPDRSHCGELGNFTLNFDDIPPFTIINNSVGSVPPAPVFNPYHQFDFSEGFAVVPPPAGPFLPSSVTMMLEFIPSFVISVVDDSSNTAEEGFSGQISDGDHGLTGCFTFDIYGAAFGCNSTSSPCDFKFTGLQYDAATGVATAITSQTVSIPACPALTNCKLAPIMLDDTFVDLNAIQIRAAAAGAPLGWWMDDLQLGWFNNSCSTGLCRQSAHIRK